MGGTTTASGATPTGAGSWTTWSTSTASVVRAWACPAHRCGALQAAAYFLWALQRLYERGEDRYLGVLWSWFSLVVDVDDTVSGAHSGERPVASPRRCKRASAGETDVAALERRAGDDATVAPPEIKRPPCGGPFHASFCGLATFEVSH